MTSRSLVALLLFGSTFVHSGCHDALETGARDATRGENSTRWEQVWHREWSPPAGERTCNADELVEDGRGGAFLQTTTPLPGIAGDGDGGATPRAVRYRVEADGTITPVRPRKLLADHVIAVGKAARAVAVTGLGYEGAHVAVYGRDDGRLRWKIAFEHVVSLFDLAFDDAGRLWVAGNFIRALRVAGRDVPVGPPHPGRLIVPRFGVAWATGGETISPERVRDGFLLRFGASGELELLKRFRSGMTFVPGALVAADGGVMLLASLTGSVPRDIRRASAPAIVDADAAALTLLLSIGADGTVRHAHALGGPSYGQRLAWVDGGLVAFLGEEERRCEIAKWQPR